MANKKFLIQTINGEVRHDFSFTLLEAIRYHNWLNNSTNYFDVRFTDGDMFPDHIPIGSVEFVSEYLYKYYNIVPRPRNVPLELIKYKFTGRNIINGTSNDIKTLSFVKSNDRIKSFTEICSSAPRGNYQISDIINIDSEWRAFVHRKELVGLQNYSGEFDVFPDVSKIKEMIDLYTTQPPAYTLDVGISNNNTVIIEVHDFFSCGLYGFSDLKRLPLMFINCFEEYIKCIKD